MQNIRVSNFVEVKRMSIKTSRVQGTAHVTIEHDRCIGCGRCVQVCCGAPLYMEDGKVQVDQTRLFGCIACGQCVAVCPQDCILVTGRDLSSQDKLDLGQPENRSSYEHLYSLMLGRRSIRRFSNRDVEQIIIDKILDAAATAPMGIPPSDVEVLVLEGRKKVREFSDDAAQFIQKCKWFFSPPMLMLQRPFVGKEACELSKSFVKPMISFLAEGRERGEDWLMYDAPLAMLFQGSSYADPADSYIAATYAMLAAQSLGLGSCMIGSIAPFIKQSRAIKEKYGISSKMPHGLVVVFGYSEIEYRRGIKRRFAKVSFCR